MSLELDTAFVCVMHPSLVMRRLVKDGGGKLHTDKTRWVRSLDRLVCLWLLCFHGACVLGA
jgi:hypothetical protein